ncbi:HAMP domain-containing sensor histidine kinase [soil metagenome]
MFHKAQLKLTIFYSSLFLLLFWLFSFGLYVWMDSSFGEGYISQVQQRQQGKYQGKIDDMKVSVIAIAGDVALDRLLTILLVLNSGLLIVIPITSWFLAKRTLSPVQKIHEQQKQFVSDSSHEMRTPLTIMSGEMEVALKKTRTVEEYKAIIVSSKQETDRLIQLVESLLFLARDDQGKQLVSFKPVDITDVVSSVIAGFKKQIAGKKLVVHFTPPQESVLIQGNESMLKQLFFNLLENSIKYTPEKGTIIVSLELKKTVFVIAIKDTGIGIDHKDQETMFDRFYRVESARSEIKGYGLGLAISKVIVERHKGLLFCDSSIGKGTTFTVELPLKSL